ncbi:MAG: TIGR03546 family protein [Elusimicrobia bacterium]|nr:TIGR03546 family protein [Elusimicrobiota bacterium]
MLIAKILFSFIRALNEKASPHALAGGFALGAIIGLTPKGSLHNVLVLFLIFLLPVNKSASLVSAILFALFSYLFDPFFNRVGELLLTRPALEGLWTTLYNLPILPWTRFNNTLVLGSLMVSLILFIPLFKGAVWGVTRYREKVMAMASKWKLVQIVKVSKIYLLYERFS